MGPPQDCSWCALTGSLHDHVLCSRALLLKAYLSQLMQCQHGCILMLTQTHQQAPSLMPSCSADACCRAWHRCSVAGPKARWHTAISSIGLCSRAVSALPGPRLELQLSLLPGAIKLEPGALKLLGIC